MYKPLSKSFQHTAKIINACQQHHVKKIHEFSLHDAAHNFRTPDST